MRRTALAALCIAAAATFSLTGCMSEDKADGPFAGLSGGEIADKAVKATSGAESLRMKGEIEDESAGGTVQMDMAMNKKGDCAGTMSMGGEGQAELIKVGDTLYMKYDEAFLRAQSKDSSKEEADMVVDMLADKWTKTSAAGEDSKDMASFCDLDTVLADFEDVDSNATRARPPRSRAPPRSSSTRRTARTATPCMWPPRVSRTPAGRQQVREGARRPGLHRLRQAGPGQGPQGQGHRHGQGLRLTRRAARRHPDGLSPRESGPGPSSGCRRWGASVPDR